MMTAPKFAALCLTCLSIWNTVQTTDLTSFKYVRQDSGFFTKNVGDNVTLKCFYKGDVGMFSWYKQTVGKKPRLVATFYKYEKNGTLRNEFETDMRFKIVNGNNFFQLIISDLRVSDSATYYCTALSSNDFEFADGAILSVKGSGLNIQTLVHQSASETIQSGDFETHSCTVHTGTCDGEHSVYWFKDSEESDLGLIYTCGDRTDQCEKKPNTQVHTCMYDLPIKSPKHSPYCAIASCGHVLFGIIKKETLENNGRVLLYFLGGALACTTMLAVFLTYAAYRMMNSQNSCKCTESRACTSFFSTPNEEESDDLHYAALRGHRINRSTIRNTESECVYSTVRQ